MAAVYARRLRLAPCTITEGRAVVARLHRHLPRPPAGGRFALAAVDEADLVRGVALVGYGARLNNDRRAATVTRVATDGTPNACSLLYGGVARVWRTMGGRVLWTYTLEHELGTSLRAAGWTLDGTVDARDGHGRPSRPRLAAEQPGPKQRWTWRAELRYHPAMSKPG